MQTIAVFDLDNTLLAGDSDFLWGEFLAEHDLVDDRWRARNAAFFEDYRQHRLNARLYLRFSVETLSTRPLSAWLPWRQRFLAECIFPLIAPGSWDLIAQHRHQGHLLIIATATNRFLTAPIAARLGVPHLIATEFALCADHFNGLSPLEPCIGTGKVRRLNRWLRRRRLLLSRCFAYSDSASDLPLLTAADTPVAVDPEQRLARVARRRGWPIISLRN